MKIYSNLDLTGNTASNLTANSLIIGQTNNQTTNGAIKWVNGSGNDPGHFEYYDLIATPGTGWTVLSTGTSQIINQYTADGVFKVAKGSNATVTGSWPQSIFVDSNQASSYPNATSITLNTVASGDVTVATSATNSPTLTLPISSGVISSIIKTGSFTIASSGYTVPITVSINHGLETQYLDFSLYKSEENGPGDSKNVYSSVMCDYYVSPSSPYTLTLYLTSSSLANVAGDYIFIIIGSTKASTITSGNITVTGTNV